MSTVIEHDTEQHDDHAAHDKGHKPDSFYIVIALVLALFTGIETSTYFFDFGSLMMPTLIVFMVLKFWTVVSYFMHLKFDNKLFSALFYTGLVLAVAVYIAMLLTFRVFSRS